MSQIISKACFVVSTAALICAITFAPIGYWGTEPWSLAIINEIVFVAGAFWVVGVGFQLRWPSVPLLPFLSAVALLLLGWGMTLNAKSLHDSEFWQFVPVSRMVEWLPGSVDLVSSQEMMVRITALFIAYLAVCDLGKDRKRFAVLMVTVAMVGAGTAAFGVYQKVSAEPFIIWPVPRAPQTAFATFWYHGNAAALLSLTLPLLIGLVTRDFKIGANQLVRAFWLSAMVIVFAGVVLNVSKAGHAMVAGIVGIYLAILVGKMSHLIAVHGWKRPLAYGVLVIAGVIIGLETIDWSRSIKRWNDLAARGFTDARLDAYRICMGLSRIGGWFGFGPGSFDAIFQHHVFDTGEPLLGRWVYAHNDYLQMVVEWGYVGSILWACFWFDPVVIAFRHLAGEFWPSLALRGRSIQSDGNRVRRAISSWQHCRLGLSLALLGLLTHGCYDFPLQIGGLQLYAVVLAGLISSPSGGRTDSGKDIR